MKNWLQVYHEKNRDANNNSDNVESFEPKFKNFSSCVRLSIESCTSCCMQTYEKRTCVLETPLLSCVSKFPRLFCHIQSPDPSLQLWSRCSCILESHPGSPKGQTIFLFLNNFDFRIFVYLINDLVFSSIALSCKI